MGLSMKPGASRAMLPGVTPDQSPCPSEPSLGLWSP
ncbi:unnamed protein product [Gulo gulo]|uniref:Uncharacterized protein n=1 Tax=Gulo gulo TaxID=48420 RepID=A0A9X9LJ13_GULGU|nr:unnamed protein product [Gulo gulo]